jgi:hypothetical protein
MKARDFLFAEEGVCFGQSGMKTTVPGWFARGHAASLLLVVRHHRLHKSVA